MTAIDEHVVKLTFDNERFAEKIKDTLSMLEHLKQNLKLDKAVGSFNSIEKAANNFDISSMGNSIDQISSRFSTMGIAGVTAIQNITTFAMQKGGQLLKALTGPIIEGGKRRALNIEQAKFQIEGLGYSWESVLDDINYGVLDTAYGLDSAAKAAGQLLASSVKVGDPMKTALRGISGVAAMTNSTYDDIARVFTTVAGNGRLMGDQLNQLAGRGINVAATLGKALGKTEAEVREMTSKGQIDFATFAKAMDDAFGAHAKEANNTFSGALSNMKASLSRIGAAFATPAYDNLRTVILALTNVFNGFNKSLAPVVTTATEAMKVVATFINDTLSGLDVQGILTSPMEHFNKVLIALGRSVTNVATAVSKVLSPIFRAFSNAFGGTLLDIIVRVAEGLANLTSKIIISDSMSEDIFKTFRGLFTLLSSIADILVKVAGLIGGTLFTVAVKTLGFILELFLKLTAFVGDSILVIKSFIDSLMGLQSVKDLISGINNVFSKLRTTLGKVYTSFRKLAVGLASKTFETSLFILNKISEAIVSIASFIDSTIQKVKQFIKSFSELPFVQKVAENLTNTFNQLKEAIEYIAPIIKKALVDSFEKFIDTASDVITKIKELIEQYVELPTLEEALEALKQFMTDVFEGGQSVFEVVGRIVERIQELTQSSFTNVINNFVSLGNRILDVLDITKHFENISQGFNNVQSGLGSFANGVGETVTGVQSKLSKFVSWIETKFSALTLGDAIAAGAGASMMAFLFSLGRFLNQAGGLVESTSKLIGGFAKIPKAIEGVVTSLDELVKVKQTQIKMEALSNIIKSVALLAGAVAALSMMDQEKIKSSAGVILVLSGALVLMSMAATRMSKEVDAESVAKSTGAMIGLAGSLIILVAALKILSGIPIDKLAGSMVALGVLMAELVAFSAALNKFAPEMKMGIQSVFAVSVALLVLSQALRNIGEIDSGDLARSLGVVSFLMLFLTLLSKIETKGSVQSAAGILGIAVAIKIIVSSLEEIANIDAGTYNAGIVRVIELMGTIALLLLATMFAGEHAAKAGVAIVLIGASLLLIAQAIKQLGSMDQGSIDKATSAIKQMLVVMSLMVAATLLAGEYAARAGVTILAAAGSMILIAGAMAVLSKLDPEGLKRALDTVSQIIALFALLVAATQVCTQAEKVIVTMGVVAAALAAVIAILSLVEPTNLTAASEAISRILLMFTLLMAATNVVKFVSMKIFLLVGVVELLALIIKQLSDIHPENALASSKALTDVMLMFAALMPVLMLVGLAQPLILPGLIGFLEVIGVLSAVMLALGGLNTLVPGLMDVLNNAIPVLEAIGKGIGSFVGSIAGSFMDQVTSKLVPFGEALGKFANAIKGFIDSAKNLDESSIGSLEKLTSLVSTLATLDFSKVSNMDGLSDHLPKLAEALVTFGDAIDDSKIDKIHKASEAAKYLAEMISYLPKGGIFSDLPDLGAFGNQLKTFGEKLNEFGDALDPQSIGKIKEAIEPTKGIVEIANAIDAIQDTGSGFGNKMYTLSKNLEYLGTTLTDYGNAVDNLKVDKIEKSVGPAKALVEIANSIGKAGGMIDAFEGTNAAGMAGFSGNLKKFGEALTEYGDAVQNLKTDKINASVGPAKSLVEIFKSLNTEQGVINWFAGSTDIASKGFIENVENLGDALKSFGEATAQMPTDGIDDALKLSDALIAIGKKFGPEGGFKTIAEGSEGIGFGSFITNINSLGGALTTFTTEVANIGTDGVDTALKIANSLAETWRIIGISGGTISILSGDRNNSMVSLIKNARSLGAALREFSSEVQGTTPDGIQAAIEIAKGLVECFNMIAPSGGVMSFLRGDKGKSFDVISANAKSFGDGLAAFATATSGITTDGISGAIAVGKGLVEIFNMMGPSGGILEFLNGGKRQSFAALGSMLPQFAEDLKSFASTLSGENAPDFSNVKVLIENVNKIKELAEAVNGANVGGAGSALRTFGEDYKSLSDNVAQVSFENVESSVYWLGQLSNVTLQFQGFDPTPINMLADALKNLADIAVNGVLDVFITKGETLKTTAVNTFTSVMAECVNTVAGYNDQFKTAGSSALDSFSEGLTSSTESVKGAANTIATTITTTIGESTSALSSTGTDIVNNISNGIHAGQSIINGAMSSVINASINVAKVLAVGFIAVGAQFMKYAASGIRANGGTLKSAISSVVQGINLYDQGYHIGYWLMEGLKNGIYNRKGSVEAAARSVMNSAISIMRNIPVVRSPSKVTTKIGQYISEGLAIGIRNRLGMVKKSSADAANGALDSMRDGLSKLSAIMSTDNVYTPVITPILDASNLEAGMNKFNNEFGYSQMNLSGSYNNLGLAFGQMSNQNMMNYSILDKLDQLVGKIQNGSNSGPTVIIDGATINDFPAMRQATKDYLIELSRLGAM